MKLRNLALLAAASLMVVGLARCGTPAGNPDIGNNGPPKDASVERIDASTTDLCGNGDIDGDEKCDGTNLNGKSCTSENFGGGDLACNSDCTFDFSACTAGVDCGNGTLDSTEQCDGTNLDNKTCQTEGFTSGQLSCNPNCSLNTSACVRVDPPDAGNVVKTDGGGSGTDENTDTLCDDGVDNDNNGYTDCADFSCCRYGVPATGITVCQAGTCGGGARDGGTSNPRDGGGGPNENTDQLCNDGVDNDNNGYTDCSDFSCCRYGVPATGITVCQAGTCGGGARDAGTSTTVDAGPSVPEDNDTTCNDGIDNDNDKYTDCNDHSCCKYGVPQNGVTVCTFGTCGGGLRDGGIGQYENTASSCSDGLDNDDDGYRDCNDNSCCANGTPYTGVTACESGTCYGPGREIDALANANARCSDGIDNNNNKYTDCSDFECCRPIADGGLAIIPSGLTVCDPVTCVGPGKAGKDAGAP